MAQIDFSVSHATSSPQLTFKDSTCSSQRVWNNSNMDAHQTQMERAGLFGWFLCVGSWGFWSLREHQKQNWADALKRQTTVCSPPKQGTRDYRQSNGDLSWPESSSASGIRGRRADRVNPQNFWGDISFLVAVNFHPMWFPQILHWATVQAYLPKTNQKVDANM